MKKISAIIMFPCFIDIEIDDETMEKINNKDEKSIENTKEKMRDLAGYILETSTIKPVIMDCNIDLLND